MNWIKSALLIGLFVVAGQCVNGQIVDRICATSRFESQCTNLQRGDSEVICQRVQDSIECAQRIRNETAEFGIFTAESALQLASLGWSDLTVVKELRHRDRINSPVDYESVVIVKADHQNGTFGLKGLSFCHPGLIYDRSQRWTERFLKHFERTVVPVDCTSTTETSPAEIETAAFANFFKDACRPGAWSNNIKEDAALKSKYPQLCSLCDKNSDSNNCRYPIVTSASYHIQALECLRNSGQVAYVSSEDAQNFFLRDNRDIAMEYAYLCPNGTKQTILDNTRPCAWLSQPWNVIISSAPRSLNLKESINRWIQSSGTNNWESAIREIIGADNAIVRDATIQAPRDYFRPHRDVPVALSLCATQSSWCTTSLEERDKCEVVRAGGVTTGVYPVIDCQIPQTSVQNCLNDVSTRRSDLTGIDSNFGFLARHDYNLTAAVYAETENDKYSSVVVVVKAGSRFERFENLKNARACIPQFKGIASMAFINTGKNRGFFSQDQCDYGLLLSDFFGSTCAPGASAELSESLCSLCTHEISTASPPIVVNPNERAYPAGDDDLNPDAAVETFESDTTTVDPTGDGPIVDVKATQTEINCKTDSTNRFYGNLGALRCLSEVGEVAILELQYLKDHAKQLKLEESQFRIMCKNGTLADRHGFDVDANCALTQIVDNEIVVHPENRKIPGIINALISFDLYFQQDPDFKLFNIFSGHKHLLFKDSTIGLASPHETVLSNSISNYIQLFKYLEECIRPSSATALTAVNLIMLLSLVLILIKIN